jgi:glycosyltransferase involved in cell wall biosynthesis
VFSGLVTKTDDTQAARSFLNLPDSGPILLFFGLVRPYKGLDVLLNALSTLRKKGIRPHLIIAGEFWVDKNKYVERLRMLDLTDQVHIFDHYIPDEELNTFFSAADAVVAPYTGGTQSAVVSLALAVGLPIILSNIVTEGIDQSYLERMYVFPAGNVRALEKKLQEFLIDLSANHHIRQPAENDWWKVAELIENFASR